MTALQRRRLAARPPRRRRAAATRTAIRVRRRVDSYADAAARDVPRPARRSPTLDVRARASGSRSCVDDEPAFPAWFLGALRAGVVPVPLSTMLTAGDLAAIVADAGAGAVVVSPSLRRPPRRDRAAATPSCATPSSIGEPAATSAVPVHALGRLRRSTTRRRSPPTTGRLAGVLALQLGHDRACRRA